MPSSSQNPASRADNAMCMCARVSVSVCVLLGQRAPSRMQSLFRLSSHRMHVRCGKEQPPASECGPGPSLCVRVCVCVCVSPRSWTVPTLHYLSLSSHSLHTITPPVSCPASEHVLGPGLGLGRIEEPCYSHQVGRQNGGSSMPAGLGRPPPPSHTCLGALWTWGSVG